MSNIKTDNNGSATYNSSITGSTSGYVTLNRYNEGKCDPKTNYLSFSNRKGWLESQENFLSLYAAVRRPFSPGYYDPNYVQPSFPGVN